MVQFAARLSDDGTRGRRRTLSDTFMASHSMNFRVANRTEPRLRTETGKRRKTASEP
jgi:hypothetical protein